MKITNVEIVSYVADRCMVSIGKNDIIGLPPRLDDSRGAGSRG